MKENGFIYRAIMGVTTVVAAIIGGTLGLIVGLYEALLCNFFSFALIVLVSSEAYHQYNNIPLPDIDWGKLNFFAICYGFFLVTKGFAKIDTKAKAKTEVSK